MRLTFPIVTILALFFLLFSACADYKMHVEGEANQTPPASLGEPEHILFVIGDAGEIPAGMTAPPAVKLLGKKLAAAPKNSSVIFLGDNVYPDGLPQRKSKGREAAEAALNAQLDILKGFKGKPFFIPGNHDWGQKKPRKGVERIEDYIEERLGEDKEIWLPDEGCSGPVPIDLSKNVMALFVDSEWYRMNWNKERELNEGCDVKSRESFAFFVQDEMKKNRTKNIVVAMHHPIYSNGEAGGRYSFKQHLFPLTDLSPKLYVPLPVVGSLFRFMQSAAGSRQQNSHPLAQDLKKVMEGSAKKNGSFIFVSGHEHSLQYFEVDGQSFVVSGAGSKRSPVGKGRGARFAYGAEPGFSILKFFPDGEVFLEFWTASINSPSGVGGDSEDGKMVYSRQIKGKLPAKQIEAITEFPEYKTGKDSVSMPLKTDVKTGGVHRFFWGDHYRKAYLAPVKAPVLDLETWRGGVTPLKRGGGSQTNSLRVEDADGRQWVLRSMVKDETRIVPYPFNKTFAKDLFADQFTSANPYTAFTIARMAKAIGIYYTTPKLYYMPKQPRLGDFNDIFGGGFYLVEERADGDQREVANFGMSKKLVSTPELLDKKEKNHNHRVDAAFTVRSRLFDNVLGDWDRHDDNWRWASFKDEKTGVTTYRPIPRDRDQPFSKYDGAVPFLARRGIPFLKQLRVYDKEVPNIKWQNYHSKYFDPTFLNEAEWSVWEREAKHIQATLTDAVIDSALHDFPPEIYAIDGEWIAGRLKGRRDNVLKIAREFYLLVSKDVDVIGTNKHDLFLVDRLDDERTRVQVFDSDKDGKQGEKVYDRTFLRSETRTVNLYGLDQEDRFFIRGQATEGIVIRCIGGLDNDIFKDESFVRNGGRLTKIYDTKTGNELEPGKEAANKTSNDPILNTYDRRSWDTEHNFGINYPVLAFNPDEGLVIGGGTIQTTYGFKKSPFAARHVIGAKVALETGGYDVTYRGEFIHAINHWDFLLNGIVQAPRFTRNYFGYGNDTPNLLENNGLEEVENFVRVRQQLFHVNPALRRQFGRNFSFSLGAVAEAVKIEPSDERFVNPNSTDPLIQGREEVFENIYFGGGEFQMNYFNADNLVNPTKGITANGYVGIRSNFDEPDRTFTYTGGHFGVYFGAPRIVFASKIGAKHVAGEFEFYQGATLGARENIRGYRNERFTGRTAVWHQNDVRIRLFNVENYVLPFTLGVLGGYDYGRVWSGQPGESANWHDAYGGGIWLSPFDLVVLNFSYFKSEDGYRFQFKGGFSF